MTDQFRSGDEFHRDFISAGLEHVSRDARADLVDSLAAKFHNFGSSLDGNTQESDLEWFAATCWADDHGAGAWDRVSEMEKKPYREFARTAVAMLPRLMARVAHRAQNWGQALTSIARADIEEEKRRRKTASP